MGKTYVKITAEHDEMGNVRPLVLTWTDGRRFDIDRVTDVRWGPSLKGGGILARYWAGKCTCLMLKAAGLWRNRIINWLGHSAPNGVAFLCFVDVKIEALQFNLHPRILFLSELVAMISLK